MTKSYILYSISISLTILFSIFIIISKSLTEISPLKQIILIVITIIIETFIITKLFLSKKKYLYNLGAIVSLVINIILVYNIIIINDEYSIITNFINNKYFYKTYNLYVLKNTIYQKPTDLERKKIGLLTENSENIKVLLSNKLKANYLIYNTQEEALNALSNGYIQCIIMDTSSSTKSNLKSIYKFKVKKEKTNKDIYLNM